jgi:hypothetical protein
MKYNDKNKPLVCMMTQSTCYKGTRKFTPKGVLWHSTGANNPWLKRYVADTTTRQRRDERLGKKSYAMTGIPLPSGGLNFGSATADARTGCSMPGIIVRGGGSGAKGSCHHTHIFRDLWKTGWMKRAMEVCLHSEP